jgi:hypothetical protein
VGEKKVKITDDYELLEVLGEGTWLNRIVWEGAQVQE